jgi:NitT/TauT family transport system ATP-binding protein
VRLECSQLSVSFIGQRAPVEVLHNLSLVVDSGEFVSIVGPSGCGKTTLLRTLAGVLPYQAGTVARISCPEDRNSLALRVFQENSLFPWMTVLENATFGLRMQGAERADREQRALILLQRFGLGGRERVYPRELSMGMKQRVAVIRCFLSNPAVMLMDEPFASLDYQNRMELHRELLELWDQDRKTVIFVTHDVEEAIVLSDRVVVLSGQPGTVVANFRVPFGRPRDPAVALEEEFLILKRRIWEALGHRRENRVGAGLGD